MNGSLALQKCDWAKFVEDMCDWKKGIQMPGKHAAAKAAAKEKAKEVDISTQAA